jgi:hypothetical protein
VSNWLARRHDLRITDKARQQFARQCGIGKVEEHVDVEPPSDKYVFRRKGGSWELIYEGEQKFSRHRKGMDLIAHLLRNPGKPVYAEDLYAAAGVAHAGLTPSQASYAAEQGTQNRTGRTKPGGVDVDDAADPQARAAYQERLQELYEERAEAEQNNDIGRQERLREEIEEVEKQLTARARPLSERFRKRASKSIRDAIEQIKRDHPPLGRHLSRITTGTSCSYSPPDPPLNWKF